MLVFNTGAAFSFLAGAGGWQRWFFIAIAVAASLIVWLLRAPCGRAAVLRSALALILGGALGNLVDRIALGSRRRLRAVARAAAGTSRRSTSPTRAITVGAALLIFDELAPKRARDAQARS